MRALRIGLTGGIGSGKSTVAALFERHGALVIDADRIARRLSAPGGAAVDGLRAAFGAAAIGSDGALDRAWMRQQAFSDPDIKRRLEALLHPLIRSAMRDEADAAPGPYVMLEIPLLVESGSARSRVDRVLVVDSPRALQLARVAVRSGLAANDTDAIIAVQASRDDRIKAADDILVNAADLAALEARVARLDRFYRAQAATLV
jgi:dephospho-CoA kinase